ncbi:MAG: hypothetical protein AAF682_03835 [Planctomycetota bacterium]
MLLALLLLTLPAQDAGGAPGAPDRVEVPAEWTLALDWLREERDRFSSDLDRARAALLARADREDQALAQELRGKPAPVRERGYRVLPRLLDDPPQVDVTPRSTSYSLAGISTAYAWAVRDAAVLARVADERPADALGPLVERYERLRKKLKNLDEHISYHAYWQERAVLDNAFFAGRNALLAVVEEWNRLRESGVDPERSAELRRSWMEQLAPFRPAEGLALEHTADGALVLPVTVVTDIEDEAFLARFERAVVAAFVESEAARARGFRVELTLRRIPPAELYADGEAPARGAQIDEQAHVARFPEGALVLTTGAKSTHSYVARSIQLGADALPPRTLAHEFGHLLGFSDAYLRAYTGEPRGAFGVTLVEWSGLLGDLMGDSRRGRVSAEMVDVLIEAYGAELAR